MSRKSKNGDHSPKLEPAELPIKDSRNLKSQMRRFVLAREEDISGNSGTGLVAEGVVYSSGRASLTWFSHLGSVAVYDSIAVVEALHGHDGATKVVWVDDAS